MKKMIVFVKKSIKIDFILSNKLLSTALPEI
jgi:hypothetical protein